MNHLDDPLAGKVRTCEEGFAVCCAAGEGGQGAGQPGHGVTQTHRVGGGAGRVACGAGTLKEGGGAGHLRHFRIPNVDHAASLGGGGNSIQTALEGKGPLGCWGRRPKANPKKRTNGGWADSMG